MAEVSIHPASSYDLSVNFWEEFPTFKLIPEFSELYRINSKTKKHLQGTSNFMWALAILYDRKSVLFNQPLNDKLEAASENIFGDGFYLLNLLDDHTKNEFFKSPKNFDFVVLSTKFQEVIDSPLGMSLRQLEAKLGERTKFLMETEYTMDKVVIGEDGEKVVYKSNVEQLDKMFERTAKINTLILEAMNALNNLDEGETRGGAEESLADSDKSF